MANYRFHARRPDSPPPLPASLPQAGSARAAPGRLGSGDLEASGSPRPAMRRRGALLARAPRWALRCLALAAAAALAWLLVSHLGPGDAAAWWRAEPDGDGSGWDARAFRGPGLRLADRPRGVPACPVQYPRLSREAIAEGATPYLYGGQAPGCSSCQRDDHPTSRFCRFLSHGQLCGEWLRRPLIDFYLERGYAVPLQLTPCDLWPALAGRTLWLSGDSQMLDYVKALQCFLYELWDLRFLTLATNDTWLAARLPFLVLPPGCILLDGGARICYVRCDRADCMLARFIPLLQRAASPADIAIVNFGLHFSPDYAGEVASLLTVWGSQAAELPFLLWKDTPAQHFRTIFGAYPSDAKLPFHCAAIGAVTPTANRSCGPDDAFMCKAILGLTPDHRLTATSRDIARQMEEVLQGGYLNKLATPIVRAAGVPIIHTWNETVALWQYHRDNGKGWECTHFCHPSGPQLWVAALFEALVANQPALNQHLERAQGYQRDNSSFYYKEGWP